MQRKSKKKKNRSQDRVTYCAIPVGNALVHSFIWKIFVTGLLCAALGWEWRHKHGRSCPLGRTVPRGTTDGDQASAQTSLRPLAGAEKKGYPELQEWAPT